MLQGLSDQNLSVIHIAIFKAYWASIIKYLLLMLDKTDTDFRDKHELLQDHLLYILLVL